MRKISSFTIKNRYIGNKTFFRLLIFSILLTLIACSSNLVTAGENGISIKKGEWVGKSDDGSFAMQFTIGSDGANVFLGYIAYPCGEQNLSILPPNPIKIELKNSAFTVTTSDHSDLFPKVVINGKFIDSENAEGTWETFRYNEIYLDIVCPASSGTWKGSLN